MKIRISDTESNIHVLSDTRGKNKCTSELLVSRLVNLNISFLAKFRNLYSYFVT